MKKKNNCLTMSKRSNNNRDGGSQKKKFKVAKGVIDPGTSGIYATCARKKERLAVQELGLLFEEKALEIYGKELEELNKNEDDLESKNTNEELDTEELSIEDQIKKELAELRKDDKPKTKDEKKKDILQFIDLDCECVVFCKTRKPIQPESFIAKIMEELADPNNKLKRTRYVQKLTPVTNSCSNSMEQLIKLADEVLKPHFHDPNNTKSYKFAVEVTRRNFNKIDKMDIIKQIVKQVTQNGKYQHKVDLKEYEKLVLVECFKSNIGISVVDGDYLTKYRKYNVQMIYEDKFKSDETTKEEKNADSKKVDIKEKES